MLKETLLSMLVVASGLAGTVVLTLVLVCLAQGGEDTHALPLYVPGEPGSGLDWWAWQVAPASRENGVVVARSTFLRVTAGDRPELHLRASSRTGGPARAAVGATRQGRSPAANPSSRSTWSGRTLCGVNWRAMASGEDEVDAFLWSLDGLHDSVCPLCAHVALASLVAHEEED